MNKMNCSSLLHYRGKFRSGIYISSKVFFSTRFQQKSEGIQIGNNPSHTLSPVQTDTTHVKHAQFPQYHTSPITITSRKWPARYTRPTSQHGIVLLIESSRTTKKNEPRARRNKVINKKGKSLSATGGRPQSPERGVSGAGEIEVKDQENFPPSTIRKYTYVCG